MAVARTRWFIAAVALALSSGAALADRIDGNWCSPAGATMTIAGARVITPNGTATEGNYERHHFDYLVPEGDDRAGAFVQADLLNEDEMLVTITAPDAEKPDAPELWKRCKVISLNAAAFCMAEAF